ncbi:MAG: cob(I)yrinic acid a,c-diamide adenosyltransferase [Acidimicrobiales bacterium]
MPDVAAPLMKVYTRRGDDGTTGLLYGGRVAKDSPVIEANGAVDEAQAALGVVRAEVEPGSELDELLVRLERELYVLMADVATATANRAKLTAGVTLVTSEMVAALEPLIDELTGRFPPLKDFVVPGHDRVAAALDVARTVTRRAERLAVGAAAADSRAAPYLNRLSDLVWTMARWQEQGDSLLSRQAALEAGLPPEEGATPHG